MKKSHIKCISYILVFCFVFFISINTMNAEEITVFENGGKVNLEENEGRNTDENITGVLDTKLQNGVYKFSENNVPYLPFIRYATDRILVDKEIGGTGILISTKSIEVTSKISGAHILFANDAVRVNAPMEYALIFGANSVTIDSIIEKSIIIYGSGEVTITENAKIKGDLICYSTNLNIKGEISGSVIGATNNINVNGKIGKDLRMQVREVSIDNENIISGYTYLETYNENLKLNEKYNAKIEYLDVKQDVITWQIIMDGIITSLLFALVYLLIIKKNDGKILDFALNKISGNTLFVVFSSVLFLVLIPIIIMILVILALVGLDAIMVPVIIAIIAFFVIECLLSTFIVGSIMARYMDKNYFAKKGISSSILGTFIIYLVLYILARVPAISGYVVIGLIMLSTGITLTCVLRKNKAISDK